MALEIFTSIYTAAQQDTLLGRVVKPVVIEDVASTYSFEVNDIVCINGILYRCTSATSNPPHTFYTQSGKLLYITINGEKCYMVASQTLNAGWEKYLDIRDRFQMEKRLATKQDVIPDLTVIRTASQQVATLAEEKQDKEGYEESDSSTFYLTENAVNYNATDMSSMYVLASSDNLPHTYKILVNASEDNFMTGVYFKPDESSATIEGLESLVITTNTGYYYSEVVVIGSTAVVTQPFALVTTKTLG